MSFELYLKLALLGEPIVRYTLHGAEGFFVNHPKYIREVLDRREGLYIQEPHPYKKLNSALTGHGRRLLGHSLASGPVRKKDSLRPPVNQYMHTALASWDAIVEQRRVLDANWECEYLMFPLVTKLLLEVEELPPLDPFIRATALIEEVIAKNREPESIEGTKELSKASKAQFDMCSFLLKRRLARLRLRSSTFGSEGASWLLQTLLNGYKPLAGCLTWSLYVLSRHPDLQERLATDIFSVGEQDEHSSKLRSFVREVLRLYPPAWLLNRVALQDDILGHTRIPINSNVSVSPLTLQRDPAYWPEPEKFDLDRFEPSQKRPAFCYFPFGGGSRSCPAARSSIDVLEVVLSRLLTRYEIQPGSSKIVTPYGMIALHPVPNVKVRLKFRTN